jgi:protein-L-isoaspartate O-methyltransferase
MDPATLSRYRKKKSWPISRSENMMRVIRSIEELDREIRECDAAATDDALREHFLTFSMAPPPYPDDPFSAAYAEHQMGLYKAISGREYSVANEETVFDVQTLLARPFPYCTASCRTIGEQLMAIGFLIRALNLKPHMRVLEFGPGWGNTTLALAQAGFHVTAVDVESRYCELIRLRAQQIGASINVVNSDFLWAEEGTEQFDAILFFECFHHAIDHLRVLRALHGRLSPGGHIILAGEPITNSFAQPWGVRLDGQSLWSIRKFGWMELGFQEEYFQKALSQTGWRGERFASSDVPWLSVWRLTKKTARSFCASADDPRLMTTGARTEKGIVFTGQEGWALHGPYIPLPAGAYNAQLHFEPSCVGSATMDVAIDQGRKVLAQAPVAARGDAALTLPFVLAATAQDVEIRLNVSSNFSGCLNRVEIWSESAAREGGLSE